MKSTVHMYGFKEQHIEEYLLVVESQFEDIEIRKDLDSSFLELHAQNEDYQTSDLKSMSRNVGKDYTNFIFVINNEGHRKEDEVYLPKGKRYLFYNNVYGHHHLLKDISEYETAIKDTYNNDWAIRV